jgi:hypothetical protein
MTNRLPFVAILFVALAADSPLFAQQVIRLRQIASGAYPSRLGDGSVGSSADSLQKPDSNQNSHWLLEPLPGSDRFLIRHVGSSRFLTAGPGENVSLAYFDRSAAQVWTIETDPKYPDPKWNAYRISTQDGRFLGVGRSPFIRASASIPDPDSWWSFVWAFDLVNGTPAPASVAMTSRQIEAAKQRAAARAQLLNVAQAAQGCWRIDYANGNASFYVFSFKADALAIHALSYAGDIETSREFIPGGWAIGGEISRFQPANGILTDARGSTLALNGRSATRILGSETFQFQKVLYAPKSGAKGITEADCSRLLSSALQRY